MRIRVEEIFHEVADLSEEARLRHFAEREIDGKTRSEVEELLAFDLTATSAFDGDIGGSSAASKNCPQARGFRPRHQPWEIHRT